MIRARGIEALEGRSLLSVAVESPALDAAVAGPSVRLIGRSLVTKGTSHTFHLVVSSSAGLTSTAVGNGDVLVSGPKGFAAPAEVMRVAPASDGTLLLVTCRVQAPGGWFDRSDNGAYRVDLREGGVVDQSGAAAPSRSLGGFRVFSRLPPDLMRLTAWPISTSAAAGPLSIVLSKVDAWCDHMPGYGPEPDNREMLLLTATLRNTSDQPLTVRLDRVFISFAESRLGDSTAGISVRIPGGWASGVMTVVLQPGETRIIQYRGNGVFPEGRHRERLHVTLQFSAGDATVAVRSSGIIYPTS